MPRKAKRIIMVQEFEWCLLSSNVPISSRSILLKIRSIVRFFRSTCYNSMNGAQSIVPLFISGPSQLYSMCQLFIVLICCTNQEEYERWYRSSAFTNVFLPLSHVFAYSIDTVIHEEPIFATSTGTVRTRLKFWILLLRPKINHINVNKYSKR